MRFVISVLAVLLLSCEATAQRYLKQSTVTTVWLGPFVDGADGYSLETGLNLTGATIGVAKHGEVLFASSTNGATHVVNGVYKHDITATESDTLGHLTITVIATDIRPVHHEFQVVTANVYDSLFGADKLEVDATQIEGADATDQIRDSIVDDATRFSGADIESAIVLASGLADSGTTTTMVDSALVQVDVDYWKGARVVFTSGSIVGQTRAIDAFDPATDKITWQRPTTVAVVVSTNYKILPGTTQMPDARDLLPVQFVWELPSRAGGSTTSGDTLRVTAGESIRAGFDCRPSRGLKLNAGTVLASMTTPTLVTPSGDVTLAKLNVDARFAKVLVTVDALATPGEHWVQTSVTTSAGGTVTLYGRVVVVAGP